jgi:hypothetical protein
VGSALGVSAAARLLADRSPDPTKASLRGVPSSPSLGDSCLREGPALRAGANGLRRLQLPPAVARDLRLATGGRLARWLDRRLIPRKRFAPAAGGSSSRSLGDLRRERPALSAGANGLFGDSSSQRRREGLLLPPRRVSLPSPTEAAQTSRADSRLSRDQVDAVAAGS